MRGSLRRRHTRGKVLLHDEMRRVQSSKSGLDFKRALRLYDFQIESEAQCNSMSGSG